MFHIINTFLFCFRQKHCQFILATHMAGYLALLASMQNNAPETFVSGLIDGIDGMFSCRPMVA